MYLRAVHAEPDISVLRQFIREHPLGILITALESPHFPTIQCTHLPWLLDIDDEGSDPELGTLRGHLAKANPHCKAMEEAIRARASSNGSLAQEVSVVFNGPVDSYVPPRFYTKTKPETGKVVPTWNYSAVQVYGEATIYFDTKNTETGVYLQKQINDLTKHAEQSIMGHTGSEGKPHAWEVSDAPSTYVDLLQKSITGIEISIKRLEGKFKMNQEMGREDRKGVVEGFAALETERALQLAQTVQERGDLKDAKAHLSASELKPSSASG